MAPVMVVGVETKEIEMTHIRATILGAGLCAFFAGCGMGNEREARDAEKVDPNKLGESEPDERYTSTRVQAASATESITEARCTREQQCNNIGWDREYSSFSECENEISSEWEDELSVRQCRSGVNEVQLDSCLTEIREEECENSFDSLALVASCSESQICDQ